MIHFDTNALIALPQWARSGHDVVDRVIDGEAAVCAVVWYEYLLGPLADGEAELEHAFLTGNVEPRWWRKTPNSAQSCSMWRVVVAP